MNTTNDTEVETSAITGKTYTNAAFVKLCKTRYSKHDMRDYLPLMPQLIELLSVMFIEQIMQHQDDEGDFLFHNCWKVSSGKNLTAKLHASNVFRRLTAEFNTNGGVVNEYMETRFFQALSNPPEYLNWLQGVVAKVRRNQQAYDTRMVDANVVSFLYRALFMTILHITYEEGCEVKLSGIGLFARHVLAPKKNLSNETLGGTLHFFPSYKAK